MRRAILALLLVTACDQDWAGTDVGQHPRRELSIMWRLSNIGGNDLTWKITSRGHTYDVITPAHESASLYTPCVDGDVLRFSCGDPPRGFLRYEYVCGRDAAADLSAF